MGGAGGVRRVTGRDMGVWADSLRLRGFWIGVAAMILVVTASNIAVQYPINDWLTWGAFTYPVAFLVNDLTNRSLGPAVARRVVLAGFVLGVVLSVFFAGWRIGLASGGAFLVAQLLDACSSNDHFRVFFEGTTRPDIEYNLTVTDTETGVSRVYSNELGQPFQAITDTSAFATCP